MNLMELRKKEHLSASSINAYVECGLQYKFSRIDKVKPDYEADSLLFGSCIHRAIADYQQKRMCGEDMYVKEIQGIFEKYWKESAEGNERVHYRKNKSFKSLMNEGKKLLRVYVENQPEEDFPVLAIEEPFVMNLEGIDVPIIGVMDMVQEDDSGTIIITDHKTAARAYSTAEADNNFQLTVYYLAAKMNGYGDREILLRLDCLIKTRTPKFESLYTVRSDVDEKYAIKKIMHVWDGIQKGVFIPNYGGWKCDYCAYRSYCQEWSLI